MDQWLRRMPASWSGRAWVTVSEVTAQAVSVDHFLLFSGRRRRTIWMAWAASGKASPAVTVVIFRVRRSARPCRRSRWMSAAGIWRQGRPAS